MEWHEGMKQAQLCEVGELFCGAERGITAGRGAMGGNCRPGGGHTMQLLQWWAVDRSKETAGWNWRGRPCSD